MLDEKGRPYYNYKGCIVKRAIYSHDEVQCETTPEIAEEVGQVIVECIQKAGKYLKMQVELDGDSRCQQHGWEHTEQMERK